VTNVLSGSVDAMRRVPSKDAHTVLEKPHLNLYTYVSRVNGFVAWNCKDPLFDDARVRRAMTHAINRENIVESIFYGYAEISVNPIMATFWASNKKITPLPYDPVRALDLLNEAGWTKNREGMLEKDGKPFRFTLLYNTGNNRRKQIAEHVQADLKKIGVEVEIDQQVFNLLKDQLKKHNFQAAVSGMASGTKVDLMDVWHTSAATQERFNHSFYSNPRVDEIIETARLMSDFNAAKSLWDELQEIIHRDQPHTHIYEPRGLFALHTRFKNVRVTALRDFDNIHEWWVPVNERRFE